MSAPLTLAALIARSAQQLEAAQQAGELSFGQGTTNALDEAAWLVLWKLSLPLDTDFTAPEHDVALSDAAVAEVQRLIDQRIATRQPAAYLTREAWLQGVPFYIDERAIVPRSLIAEVLADGSIDPWLHPQSQRVLDLCTGNGSLAILAAMAFPDVTVQGLDISRDALAVARINVDRHQLQDRVTLTESDGLQHADGLFDVVLCNPPYVNAHSMAALPAEFKAEPELALAGGDDGMDFIRTLLQTAPEHMQPHAVLVLEIGHERPHFEAAFPALEVVWLPSSAGDDQVLLITREALDAFALSQTSGQTS
jgi:ribosomal protein L3 glutamine methyltransferase